MPLSVLVVPLSKYRNILFKTKNQDVVENAENVAEVVREDFAAA